MIATGLLSCTKKDKAVSDSIVLKVNNSTLSTKQFAELLAYQLRDLSAVTVKDPNHIITAKNKVVNDYIMQIITRDWAKQNEVQIQKDGEDGWENEVLKLKSNYPDELAFRQSLNQVGLAQSEWEARVRFSVLQKKVMSKLNEQMEKPTEKDLKDYYKNRRDEFRTPPQAKLKQIVVSTEADAKRILQELRGRRSIEDLAKKFSISPEGELGGDLGWVEKGTAKVFDTAFTMKVGRLSHIIKSPFGYHIYKVIARKQGQRQPFAEVKDEIYRRLLSNREQAIHSAWLEEQIRKTRVFKNESLINQLIVETRGE
tara:strand:+ start:109113 stop:110051 length:939 start_codon:yes stop_codon:yes gene_type:complete